MDVKAEPASFSDSEANLGMSLSKRGADADEIDLTKDSDGEDSDVMSVDSGIALFLN